ncbi:abortive infection system antitoxin AbiGi family protein [Actinoplanes sp. G11-F43]|uniref:abortive infection system antitoxin AbiGi family protein n=1 Tax=Actinoplanes sp. G11-F43 TaxID=3424130 RepID=UPI003D34E281
MDFIEDLLHRRTDLSTFLIHLTRDSPEKGGPTARENLLSILDEGLIEARTAFGPAAHLEDELRPVVTQKVVCFTETPLEHTWMMLKDIKGRTVHFQPYGLAITKTTARKGGCNPVWYSHMALKKGQWKDFAITAINEMVRAAKARATGEDGAVDYEQLSAEPVFKLTPFFEQMGYTSSTRKEFWWEREWRHIGDYHLPQPRRIVAVLAPADDHDQLREDLAEIDERWSRRPLLDPRWGLERMIAAMAQISDEHIGPFPERD